MKIEELIPILDDRNWGELISKANSSVVRRLMNRILVNKDGLQFYRAVEALGVVSQVLEKKKPGYSAELVRRYFWNLNEESGGTAWNASEAIGSIMAHNPNECGHFNWLLSGLIEDESLREGALWGLAQVALVAPVKVYPVAERVLPMLEAEDSQIRGLAAWVFALMQPINLGLWRIPDTLGEKLEKDKEKVMVYLDGRMQEYTVAELFTFKNFTFFSEEISGEGFTWPVTVASSSRGVCWVGLGEPEEEEKELMSTIKRWYPKARVIRNRANNEKVLSQLREYFLGQRQEFDVSLDMMGTPFQKRVWEELIRIPYGETRTYEDIANNIGNPQGQRAVGGANNKNPIGIIIPCHRVVGKSGSLVGYAGGIHLKEELLKLESRNI